MIRAHSKKATKAAADVMERNGTVEWYHVSGTEVLPPSSPMGMDMLGLPGPPPVFFSVLTVHVHVEVLVFVFIHGSGGVPLGGAPTPWGAPSPWGVPPLTQLLFPVRGAATFLVLLPLISSLHLSGPPRHIGLFQLLGLIRLLGLFRLLELFRSMALLLLVAPHFHIAAARLFLLPLVMVNKVVSDPLLPLTAEARGATLGALTCANPVSHWRWVASSCLTPLLMMLYDEDDLTDDDRDDSQSLDSEISCERSLDGHPTPV